MRPDHNTNTSPNSGSKVQPEQDANNQLELQQSDTADMTSFQAFLMGTLGLYLAACVFCVLAAGPGPGHEANWGPAFGMIVFATFALPGGLIAMLVTLPLGRKAGFDQTDRNPGNQNKCFGNCVVLDLRPFRLGVVMFRGNAINPVGGKSGVEQLASMQATRHELHERIATRFNRRPNYSLHSRSILQVRQFFAQLLADTGSTCL